VHVLIVVTQYFVDNHFSNLCSCIESYTVYRANLSVFLSVSVQAPILQ